MRKRVINWLPAIVWAIGIFILSSLSHPPTPGPQFPMKDKVGHWILYCVLGWFVARALRQGHNLPLPKTLILAVVIASAYGASDEFHQYFVPHRSCDVFDWVADTLGASAAVAAYYAYESRRSSKANC